ncbi:MAG TPA: tetratricopeptide repeat protein [Lachnospiraceae bacterium]|nr:tetratricopeptide repeat protein [Lachnospiraceae bacterium]
MKKTIFLMLACLLFMTGCARSDARKLFLQASDELTGGTYDTAAADFQKTVDSGYYLSESYRGLGLAYMCQSDYADACIAFEKSLLNVDSQSAGFVKDVNLYLAYCRQRHGEADKAMEIYNTLLEKESDPDVLFLRGRLHMEQNDSGDAKTDFDKAASLSSDYDLFINIYEVYAANDKKADGSAYLEQALTIVNQSETDYYNKGLVNYYLQNYDDAKDYLIKAIQENSEDDGSILLLGKVYLDTDDVADARAMYKEHLDDKKNAAAAYNGLALCDMAENNYDAALADVQSGLAYDDESANRGLRFNEIVIYEHQRDWNTAKTKAAAYVGYYPTDEAGLRENEFLETR